jgi:hypothetical protein
MSSRGRIYSSSNSRSSSCIRLRYRCILLEICAALNALANVEALVLVLGEAGISAQAIVPLLNCLDIEITLDEVIEIIGN